MESTIVASIAFSFVTCILFGVVARVIGRRDVSTPMRGANRAFVTWWAALAVSTFLTGTQTLLAASGYRNIGSFIVMALVNLVLICLALWGLLHYLLVLIVGTRRFGMLLGLLYIGLAVYFCILILTANYDSVRVGRWTATLQPQPQYSGFQTFLLLALILGPQILAALAYLTLYFRVDDAAARKRILIVSLSILIWFGTAFIVALLLPANSEGDPSYDAWQWVSRLLGVAAAAAILYAYTGLSPGDRTPAPDPTSTQDAVVQERGDDRPRLAPAAAPPSLPS